jgi:ELWxxDGT repeat protein
MMNNLLFFSATSGDKRALWHSDGTGDGTALVTTKPDHISGLRSAGDKLFFFAGDQTLWVSDGTDAGTEKILEYDDVCLHLDSFLFPVASRSSVFVCLLFYDHGSELWASDGTPEGTYMVKDINPGEGISEPTPQILFNEKVYFAATDIGYDRELWVTDGSEEGTQRVVDFNRSEEADSFPGPFSPLGGDGQQIIFRADVTSVGNEPIITDGTKSGTMVLKDIMPGPDNSMSWLKPVTLSDGRFFFTAKNKDRRTVIWTSDGTTAGTTALIEACSESVDYLAASTHAAFFTAQIENDQGGCGGNVGLWRTDGTTDGTVHIVDEWDITQLLATSRYAFYINDYEYKLWAVAEGDETPVFLADYVFTNAVNGNDFYFYRHEAGEEGWLWKSDGTAAGTVQIKESDWIERFYPAGEKVYFLRNEAGDTRGLWVTDGTAGGTTVVLDGLPFHAGPNELVTVGDIAYFIVRTSGDDYHYAMWRTDGTPDGTKLLKDFPQWKGNPPGIEALNDLVFLNADDGSHGNELWVSDGTDQGTQMVADINPVPGEGSNPHEFAARGDTLYFSADDGQHGFEPWVYKPFDDVQAPSADFSASPTSGAPPLVVNFSNLSSGEYDSCAWSFGDGANSNDCKDPSHTYSIPGNFQVSLTVSGPGGENTKTKKDFIHVIHVIEDDHWIFMPSVWGD